MLSRTVQLFSRKQTLSVVTCLPCDTESFLTCAPSGCVRDNSKNSTSRTLCAPKLHPYISSVKLPFSFPRAGTLFTRSPGCSLDPISFGLSQRLAYHMQTRSLWSATNCVKNCSVLHHLPLCIRSNHERFYHNRNIFQWKVEGFRDEKNIQNAFNTCLVRLYPCRYFSEKDSGGKDRDVSKATSDETGIKLDNVETTEVKEWLQEIRDDFKSTAKQTSRLADPEVDNVPGISRDTTDSKSGLSSPSSSSDSDSDSEIESVSDSDLEDHTIKEVLDHAEFYADDGHKLGKGQKKLAPADVDKQSKLYSEVSEYANKVTKATEGELETEEDLVIEIEEFSDYESDWEEEVPSYTPPIPLTRGQDGVFDLDDLVTLLREEKVKDMCVIRVPPDLHYVDHLILVTAMSLRHNTALTQTIHWIYKRRKGASDPTIHIEKGHNWTAIDLGNIALHIMSAEVREEYDIETLWTCGSEFDEKSRDIDVDPYALPTPPTGIQAAEYGSNKAKD